MDELKVARMWKYPDDIALASPYTASFPKQVLVISANPEDHELPWGVILADKTMYDFACLSWNGEARAVTNWEADNYWFPRMWIEVEGCLEIIGQSARIAKAVKRG